MHTGHELGWCSRRSGDWGPSQKDAAVNRWLQIFQLMSTMYIFHYISICIHILCLDVFGLFYFFSGFICPVTFGSCLSLLNPHSFPCCSWCQKAIGHQNGKMVTSAKMVLRAALIHTGSDIYCHHLPRDSLWKGGHWGVRTWRSQGAANFCVEP